MTDMIGAWLGRCKDPATEPFEGMEEAGLFAPADSYLAIARTKAALVERTGLLGIGGAWGGRQLVGRFFIDGFGTAEQRNQWRGRAASVAISEPKVGAHPKHLRTRAEPCNDGFRITGEKAWVSNAPSAEVIIVLAITAVQSDRKQYSAFLVPRGTPGMTVNDMPGLHMLRPSRHATVVLNGCIVPNGAVLGEPGSAYPRMALPFRDVEDAVGVFGVLGAFRFFLPLLAHGEASPDATLSLGGLAALAAVGAAAAEAAVAALDAGPPPRESAVLVGLRVLMAEMLQRARTHVAQFGLSEAQRIDTILADVEATLSIARGPRLARQSGLGEALWTRSTET
ncbi:MAG TPA: acyl-CoA dehydrogenase family protein [Acetobacteraceae bacterium]|nr:acyl-CoA dehydrogenase family protein [Acetobacteraceae bacterium]